MMRELANHHGFGVRSEIKAYHKELVIDSKVPLHCILRQKVVTRESQSRNLLIPVHNNRCNLIPETSHLIIKTLKSNLFSGTLNVEAFEIYVSSMDLS
jgi:hypothetical protein